MTVKQEPGGAKGLGTVALVGSALQMAGRGLRALIGIATVAVLARYLTPADFGAFALIYALVMLAQVFADLGLRVALVQKTEITDLECQSVFWVSTLSGLAITALLILFAHPLAALLDNPQIAPFIQAVSPVFILIGMRGVPMALLERRFMFKQIALTDLAAAAIGSITALAFAFAGGTISALVAQQVAMVIVLAAMLFFYARWLPRFQFSQAAVQPLMGYGSYVTLTGVLFTINQMIERPLIGSRMSTTDLGYLTMGDQIVMTPVRVIASNVRRVTFPLLSSIQHDNSRIVSAHCRTLHALALTLAPCVFGLAAIAEPFSILLLGPAWAPVTTIIAIISVRALVGSVGEINDAVFASKGKARFQFGWNVFSLSLTIVALLISMPFGIEAVAASRLVTSLFIFIPLQTWFLARLLGTGSATLLAPMARPVLAAALMAAAVHAADMALESIGFSLLLRATCGVLLGAVSYGLLVLIIDKANMLELLGKVRSARQARMG